MSNLPAAYIGLEPAEVWRHFGALNAIPRPSGHEEAACAYVQRVAQSQRAMWQNDARGNICVSVPARGVGIDQGVPTIVLQSHLDMVCQQRPDVKHNFDSDPILPQRDGDKISATGTTLGADNGLGAAMMLALLTSSGLKHPPLELLFTVEEETGLFGAAHLDPTLVNGRQMINLDSEDPDEITIGCAGGAGATIVVPIQRKAIALDGQHFHLMVGGLQGGHSGVQIHEPLANAIKLMSELLVALHEAAPEMRLVALDGGTAHNAIPRDCVASLIVPTTQVTATHAAFARVVGRFESTWRSHEPGITAQLAPAQETQLPLDAASTATILRLVSELPHGVAMMSERFAGKVQTSTNLAEVKTHLNEIEWHVSIRSFLASDIAAMQSKLAEIGGVAHAQVTMRDGYPGWEPRFDSPLQQKTVAAFEAVTGHTPKVEVVHAGLECGILSEKLPSLDAVSFGPLIRGAHTPEEWTSISSVELIWQVLTTLLAS